MSDVLSVQTTGNTIRVELEVNHLNKDKHDHDKDYLARIDHEKTMDVKDICSSILVRSGFSGDLGQMTGIIEHYHQEVIYRLCNGYNVTNDFFTLYTNVGGTFKDEHTRPTPEHNPFGIRLRKKKRLNDVLKKTTIIVKGYSEADFCITTFVDTKEREEWGFIPGHIFDLQGHAIKIEGDDPDNGLYLIPVNIPPDPCPTDSCPNSPAPQIVKIMEIAINEPGRIIGRLPDSLDWHEYRLEIRTQYSPRGLLKTPRTTASRFIIEHL